MKLQKIFSHLTFAVLFCTLAVADDDIADFDFTDMKEIERSHDINGMKGQLDVLTERGTLVKFDEFEEENQVRPFDWREKILRGALSKALTNSSLRQKFVEVMPILRVLSSQQRLALSALISSQINANMDHGLNFEQVRMMFGDDKKLLIPIIYDIANLVWNSAQKYVYHDMNTHSKNQYQQKTVINRRLDILSLAELSEEGTDKIIGNLSISSDKGNNELSLENFFSETAEKILDPQSINEELQEGVGKSAESKLNIIITLPKTQNELSITKRNKRAVVEPEFVHKLIRSIPLSNNPEENETKNIVKLNTSGFLSSKDLTTDSITKSANISLNKFSSYESTPHTHNQTKPDESYQDIENTAFASFNETQQQESTKSVNEVKAPGEPLPMPEELNAGPRYRITKNKMHSRRPNLSAAKRKRIQTPRARTKITANGNSIAPSKKCERFTSSMCIRTDDYPLDQIMGSIRRHKNAMVALWADYHDKSFHLDITDDLEEYPLRRREDDATGGGMCQSIVRYARPQKARSASGEWKYIVNTGKHTQTLRLEKCTTPQESCSYLAQSYRSHCAQIYNYHRLLSWDKTRGLHVDIFKVPTCCSCQVDGFRQQFPPLAKLVTKEFTPAYSSDVYSTINEELDYNDKLDEEDLTYQIHSGFRENHKKHDIGYYNNELLISSQSVQTKLHSPNPTLGLYLKPPGDEQEYDGFDYKHQHVGKPNISSSESPGKITIESSRERPYKSLGTANINSEARVDLDFSPSELHHEKEVNFSGSSLANPNKRVQQKRQRINSVPHIANISTTSSVPERDGPALFSTSNNFYMAPGFESPSTMAGPYKVSESHNNVATNAHQASAPGSYNHSSIQKQPNSSNNVNTIYKNRPIISRPGKNPKPRYRSAAATSTTEFITATVASAIPSQTESTNQWDIFQAKQPTPAQPTHIASFHMNSIYNSGYNKSTTNVGDNIHNIANDSGGSFKTDSGTKRINYSYHPIIDFFETHKLLTSEAPTASSSVLNNDIKNTNPFPHRITKYQASQPKVYGVHQSHERRIGFSIGSNVNSAINFQTDDNAWQPVIVERK